MIVDLAMRLANVCAILVKIGAGLTLADRAKILGDANIGVDEVIGVEDDILPVDLVEAYAHALLHTKIGERHVVALIGHRSEEHTSELQSTKRTSYADLCLKTKKTEHRR